jgi:ubiquinone biosynthesis protein
MTPGRDPGASRGILDAWADGFRASVDKLVGDLRSDARRIAQQGGALGSAVAARVKPLVDAARASPRAARLVAEAGVILGGYRLLDARTRLLSPEAARAERDAVDRRSAERVYDLCVELRGALLKLGQFASTRRDLLPPAYVEALGRLQDSVPPVPFDAIAERVRAELGAPIDELFASFEEEPIAAASLAQVHGAVLLDGTRAAVKVQVPGVESQVEGDLALFELLAATLRGPVAGVDLASVAAELGRSVREELDYRLEASRARQAADDVAADPAVLVPRVHEQLSSARVLTMDRIDGERLTDFLDRAGREPGGEAARDRVLAALVRTYAAQILGAGRFQADPHPGNFLVGPAPEHRLALLDFGAIRELTPPERRAYAALVAAVIARDRARAAALIAELGFSVRPVAPPPASSPPERPAGPDADVLVEFADLLLDAFRPSPDRPLADLDPRADFERALGLARQTPILIPHHFVQIGRVLAALAGLVLGYRPHIALWPLVAPYLTAT